MDAATGFRLTIGEAMPTEYTTSLKKGEKRIVGADPVTAGDQPTVIDGAADWRTTGPAIVEVTATPDGKSAQIVGVGWGTADVFVRGDADMTTGQKFVETVIHVTVAPDPAVGFKLTIGDPIPA